MAETKKPACNNEITEADLDAFRRLTLALGLANLILLADKVEEVINDTGWGDVKIIIAEKRVTRLKVEKSY